MDIAKRLFHIGGMKERSQVVSRKRLARPALMSFIAILPPVLIGMEACGATFPRHALYAPIFSQLKVGAPTLLARMKQSHDAACLSARPHAKVSGIPSSHAKYPFGSGALSLRGYFAWSGI